MDHGHGHADHDGGMDPECSQMHMLWNSQVAGTCVVFPQWHIRSGVGMVLSCLAIMGISIAYARLLRYIRTLDRTDPPTGYTLPGPEGTSFPPAFGRLSLPTFGGTRDHSPVTTSPPPPAGHRFPPARGQWTRRARVLRAALYALTVAISFFLMLVAMTYNTYLFSAIIVGSFIGHYIYESDLDTS